MQSWTNVNPANGFDIVFGNYKTTFVGFRGIYTGSETDKNLEYFNVRILYPLFAIMVKFNRLQQFHQPIQLDDLSNDSLN